jgi:hypothetical protein
MRTDRLHAHGTYCDDQAVVKGAGLHVGKYFDV